MANPDQILNFVAAEPNSGAHDLSAMDSDLYSWMMMNADMFNASQHHGGAAYSTEAAAAAANASVVAAPVATATAASTSSASTSPVPDAMLSAEEKRKRKLEKNREIARNCRKRKRERMSALEDEVTNLRNWNRQLQLMLSKGKGGQEMEHKRKREVEDFRRSINDSSVVDGELARRLQAYKETYSDFGRERKAAVEFHLEQLKALLLPNQVSKMTMWSLEQDDEFYDEKKNKETYGGGIWNMICKELELTEVQKKKLIEHRHQIRLQRQNVGQCLHILAELSERAGSNIDRMHAQMGELMSIITPRQQVKFLLWIENNQACLHMLQPLFSASGREHPPEGRASTDPSPTPSADDSSAELGAAMAGSAGAMGAGRESDTTPSPNLGLGTGTS